MPRSTRRTFLRRALAASLATCAGGAWYAWRVEPHWLEVSERKLPVAGLPAALAGCSLVQLSDLHVGTRVSSAYLKEAFARVARLAPDFVVITGDWISYDNTRTLTSLHDVLLHLPHGKRGTIGILGNHDFGHHWSQTSVADRVATLASDAGVSILRNTAVTCEGLQFLGLGDLWSPEFAPQRLLATHANDPATVVLSHNPDACDLDIWLGYRGWILAGHTHGGQCRPPFLPPALLPVKNRRYTSGAFELSNGRQLYINRGLGHLLRVRFNVRPEITCFRLTATRAADSGARARV